MHTLQRVAVIAATLLLTAATSRSAEAQNGRSLSGTVVDTLGAPIRDAEIRVDGVTATRASDDAGRFRFEGLTRDSVHVTVRSIGYVQQERRFALGPADTAPVIIVMPQVARVSTVVTTAVSKIPSFDEHRAMGFGQFLTREDLAVDELQPLSTVLVRLGSASLVFGQSNRAWLATTRPVTSMNRLRSACGDPADAQAGANCNKCYSQVWIDHTLVYHGRPGEPLFDLNSVLVSQIEAIEYYASAAQVPGEYAGLDSECGAIVIYRRRL